MGLCPGSYTDGHEQKIYSEAPIPFPEESNSLPLGLKVEWDQSGCTRMRRQALVLVCTRDMHLRWGTLILYTLAPVLGWICKEWGLSTPSSGEEKTSSKRSACTPGVSLVESQGAARKGARKAWGCSAGGHFLAQRGKPARGGRSTGNGEGNSFSTDRDAGASSLLRQVIPA